MQQKRARSKISKRSKKTLQCAGCGSTKSVYICDLSEEILPAHGCSQDFDCKDAWPLCTDCDSGETSYYDNGYTLQVFAYKNAGSALEQKRQHFFRRRMREVRKAARVAYGENLKRVEQIVTDRKHRWKTVQPVLKSVCVIAHLVLNFLELPECARLRRVHSCFVRLRTPNAAAMMVFGTHCLAEFQLFHSGMLSHEKLETAPNVRCLNVDCYSGNVVEKSALAALQSLWYETLTLHRHCDDNPCHCRPFDHAVRHPLRAEDDDDKEEVQQVPKCVKRLVLNPNDWHLYSMVDLNNLMQRTVATELILNTSLPTRKACYCMNEHGASTEALTLLPALKILQVRVDEKLLHDLPRLSATLDQLIVDIPHHLISLGLWELLDLGWLRAKTFVLRVLPCEKHKANSSCFRGCTRFSCCLQSGGKLISWMGECTEHSPSFTLHPFTRSDLSGVQHMVLQTPCPVFACAFKQGGFIASMSALRSLQVQTTADLSSLAQQHAAQLPPSLAIDIR